MLLELMVENYAVVDRLRVGFHPGLNLLTGETGSGKSIIVDALALLLGGRASTDMIRSGEDRARIAGIFDIGEAATAQALLANAGFQMEDGELLIEREILTTGKSRAYISSRPAAIALLRELAPYLGDIHGQHDQQLLFAAESQREMLDAFAGAGDLLTQLRDTYDHLRQCEAQVADLERNEQEKLRLLDLWRFQRQEIEGIGPQAGEDTTLENERRVLQNLGRLQESAGAAYAALYDSPESALSLLRMASKRLDELCRIDPALGEIREALKPAEIATQEGAYALRDYLSRLEADPGRLEEIESRLAALDKLKRKYGASIDETLAFLGQVRAQIDAVENAGERIEVLHAERQQLSDSYDDQATRLSSRRKQAARKLEQRVEQELASLAMERTTFKIALSQAPRSEWGTETVGFLVSPNLGEEPKPLEKVASGGEISRIALALKTCLAGLTIAGSTPAGSTPAGAIPRTLVFDEVDSGIGGSAAEGVGRRLKKLATSNQVLCVTHLAQIACFADHHYLVEKREQRGRTVAAIHELDTDARTREIGRMLSGQKLTPEALRHAEQLIKVAR